MNARGKYIQDICSKFVVPYFSQDVYIEGHQIDNFIKKLMIWRYFDCYNMMKFNIILDAKRASEDAHFDFKLKKVFKVFVQNSATAFIITDI